MLTTVHLNTTDIRNICSMSNVSEVVAGNVAVAVDKADRLIWHDRTKEGVRGKDHTRCSASIYGVKCSVFTAF